MTTIESTPTSHWYGSLFRYSPISLFAAGFISVLVFQQGPVAILHAVGFTPATPFSTSRTWPMDVPQIWALSSKCAWPRWGHSMQNTSLARRSILVVEDEPLIALDIEQNFAKPGATVLPARTLGDAHHLVEQNNLSAAVLDFRGGDAHADALCAKLIARDILFVIHSGYAHSGYAHTSQRGAVVIPKPASPGALIGAIAGLLSQKEIPHAESPQADRRCSV
jgi:ActR/RegA family two-component response regulator